MSLPLVTTLLFLIGVPALGRSSLCTSTNRVFHVQVDLFASALGHYKFEECGDVINPTLGLSVGQTYQFVQSDRTNYFHPIAIGSSSARPTTASSTFYNGSTAIGQETYDTQFVMPTHLWAANEYSLQVTIDESFTNDSYYYYCSIHQGMEGPIQILTPLTLVNQLSSPSDGDSLRFDDTRSDFDKLCGTFGLEKFQLPNPLCPDRFVCGTEEVTDELQQFSACLEAANCAMMSGMTTGVKATQDSALFIHQMIPHHENAVNTAKTLLKTGNLLCPDLTDTENPDCVLSGILLEIVAGQNHQIQLMKDFLRLHKLPLEDNCDVFVKTVDLFSTDDSEDGDIEEKDSGAFELGYYVYLVPILVGAFSFAL